MVVGSSSVVCLECGRSFDSDIYRDRHQHLKYHNQGIPSSLRCFKHWETNIKLSKKHADSLLEYGLLVLSTTNVYQKAMLTIEAKAMWMQGIIPLHKNLSDPFPCAPDLPARPSNLKILDPEEMPKRSKHSHNSSESRIMLIHSLCHIESYAIDLAWDIIVRFASTKLLTFRQENDIFSLPTDFFVDWLRVANEEAEHFCIWYYRLKALGSYYGALPVHNGLWQSATETKDSLLARLAIVHSVHEARGLDMSLKHMAFLKSSGDIESAGLLQIIERDELTHVSSGVRWFKFLCQHKEEAPLDPIKTFHKVVSQRFRGSLKPPFATEMRRKAGFTEEWYLPLVHKDHRSKILIKGKKKT